MAKSSKKNPAARRSQTVRSSRGKKAQSRAVKPPRSVSQPSQRATKQEGTSKQSRVIAMLQAPEGTTITAIMQATGWQQHSVRGFFAGVVRKKLKLQLVSNKVGDERIYRIKSAGSGADKPQPNPASA